jgi:hypothetical protein
MFKNFNFFIIGTNFYVAYTGSASASGMRIPDADPGDQNHADPCECGSATLVVRKNEGVLDIPSCQYCRAAAETFGWSQSRLMCFRL